MTQTLDFEITPHVLNRFPSIAVYAVRVTGVARAAAALDTEALLHSAAASFAGHEGAIAQHPVLSHWRTAYASMGVKPSRYRSSIEALARRAIKGADLATRIPLVDLYNACSLQTVAPIGAYDMARLSCTALQLRNACPGADQFEPLGAEASAFPLAADLVVYASGTQVLCWGFNVRDSAGAALLDTSDDVVFFSEAVAEDQHERSERALWTLRRHVLKEGAVCSGIMTATRAQPSFCCPRPG